LAVLAKNCSGATREREVRGFVIAEVGQFYAPNKHFAVT
jgi:hypothetical protein